MGAFNVINRASMAAGAPEDVTQVLANFDAIAAILNGGIDNSNVNPAAAILASKLAGYPTDGTKALFGDGTWKVTSTGIILKAAPVTVVNTVAITDLVNVVIPAGAMGSQGKIRVDIPAILNVAAGETFTYTVTLGGQTIGAWNVGGIGIASFLYSLHLEIIAVNATNAQYGIAYTPSLAGGRGASTTGFQSGAPAAYYFSSADAGTTADMTAAQTLKVQATHSVANAGNSLVSKGAIVEVIQ